MSKGNKLMVNNAKAHSRTAAGASARTGPSRMQGAIACLSLAGIILHLLIRYASGLTGAPNGGLTTDISLEVFAGQSPEQKVAIVRAETEKAPAVFLGDGISDAPALTAATVGIAFCNYSEITGEAADPVILDGPLEKVDVRRNPRLQGGFSPRTASCNSLLGYLIDFSA
jgi:hypothetical protein